jgi:hypothetical protein
MRTQEEAFRAYYASMTDGELLALARNQKSFIPVAQTILSYELNRRQLTPPREAAMQSPHSPSLFAKLRAILRTR